MGILDLVLKKEKEEEKEQKKDKQSGGGGGAGALTEKKEEENPLDVLNETIETKYKEYLKLEKTLNEFDTTLEGVPPSIQPSVIANHNKGVNKLNSLIGTLQTDIAKRDQIISVIKKQEFVKQKMLSGEEVSRQKTVRHAGLQSSSILDKPSAMGGALGISQPLDLDKINKYVAAPLKGVSHGIYSTPQAIGGLMRMLGENMQAMEGTPNIFKGDESKYTDLMKAIAKKPDKALYKPIGQWLINKSQEIIKENREYLKKKELHPDMDDKVASWLFQLGSGATSLAGAIGISVLTGSPHAAAIAFGMYQTGSIYQEARETNVKPKKATTLAITAGVIEGALEYIGLQWLFTKFGGNFWVNRLLHAGLEGFQEFCQQLGENFVAIIGWDKLRSLFQGAGESTSIGAVLGGGASTITANIEDNTDLKGLTDKQKKGLIESIVNKQLEEIAKILPNLNPKTIIEKVKTDPDIQRAILGIFEAEQEQEVFAYEAKEPIIPEELKKEQKELKKVKKTLFRADIEGKVRISSVKEPFFYLAENKKTADRFAHGGDQGRPGAKTRTYDVNLNIYDNEKVGLLKEKGKITFEQLRDNKDDIVNKLEEAGYGAIYVYELNGDRTIAVLETGLDKVTLKAEPKPPTISEELEAKREMLRKRGVKENLLTDEFVKKAKITELPKADVTGEIEELTEAQKKIQRLREAKIVSTKEEIPKAKELEEKEKLTIKGIDFEKNPEVYRAIAKADDIIEKSKLKIKYPANEIDIAIKELKDAMMDKTLNTKDKKQIMREFIELKDVQKQIKMKPTEYTEVEVPEAKMLPEKEKPIMEAIPKELEPLAEEARKIEKQAIKTYGTIEELSPYQGSYILENGKLLDLDDAGHRELGINDFGRETGGLRLRVTPAEVNVDFINTRKPTQAQMDKIEDLLLTKQGIDKNLVWEIVDKDDKHIIGTTESGEINAFQKMKAKITDFYNQATAKPTTEKKAEIKKVSPAKQEKEPPKVPPIPPKKIAEQPEPEFNKDIKVGDVYTIGERTPTKKVKGKVREITGQTKQDKILIAELDILDLVLKGEAKGARKAFSEGKKEGIFKAKEHFEDVVARAKERKAQKDYVNKLIKDINKLPTQNIAIDYKDKIEAIKDMFDLKKRQQKTLKAREETAKFIEREMAKGNTNLKIPQEEIDLIKKIPLNEMTIEQLETTHDNILSLAHIGKTKGRMIKLAEKKARVKLVEQLTDTILQGEKITPKQKGYHTKVRGLKEKFGGIWNKYFVNLKLDEALLEEIDGMKKGINWETIYKPVNEDHSRELKSHFKEIEDYMDFLDKNKIDFIKFLTDKKQYGDSEFTSDEKVGVYLASLDEDARRHIQRSDTLDISDKDIEAVTNSLTKEEKAYADYLTKYQLRQGDAIDTILVNTEGKHLRRVKNRYPIQVLNDELNNDAVMDLEHGNPMRRRAYLEKGFLKNRTKHAISAINISATTSFLRDMTKVEHWKAYTETTRDLNQILFDPKFKEAVIQKKERIVYDNLIKWFRDAVNAKQGKLLSDADKVMMFLRTNAAISMLGINIVSSMRQLVSLSNATAEIGLPAILSGIRQVSLNYAVTKQFVFSKDEQMKRRHYQFEQVFQEQIGQIMAGKTIEGISKRQAKSILSKLKGKPELKKQTMFLIKMFDEFTVLSVWKGSYDLVITKHRTGDGKSVKFTDMADLERQAIEYASAVMRKTQPMVAAKDLPQWFREGGVVQLFNMFQNQINKNWNYINHDIFKKLFAKEISPYTASKRILFGWFVPSILLGMITRGRPPKDWKEIATDMSLYLGGGLFFIGAFAINAIRGYGGYTSPVLAFGSDIVKAATYKTTESRLKHGISVFCKINGIPYNQPYRTIDGLEDWITGETDDIRRLIWTKYVLEQGKKKKVVKGKTSTPKGYGKKYISKPSGYGKTTTKKPKGYGN